jgi:riboflavin synthase
MFTGIIEKTGKIVKIEQDRTNFDFTLEVDFADELNIDQSMAHDGCCLTIVKLDKEKKQYVVTAMEETMLKANLGTWKVGDEVNLERSMRMDGRFDGHIVQGHVDQTAVCEKVVDENGSWRFYFTYDPEKNNFTVPKGSISVNGVSLTVCNPTDNSFQVNIIPYTYDNTNFHAIEVGTKVNIEFDIIGKYIARIAQFSE